jgi:Bacteriophage HK97-gp10, putative tail-component
VNLSQFADALNKAADAVEDHAATDAAEKFSGEFKDKLQENTPVETGALRDSEWVDSVTGSGEEAWAVISTHLPLYAGFRDRGGEIWAHDRPRGGWTGPPTGSFPRRWGVHQHTLHWPGGPFPLHVTQAGSHYMARTIDWANGGPCQDSAVNTVVGILHDAGL